MIGYNEVFSKYVDFLFDLKQKKIPKSKDILNRLWGILCEINKKKYYDDEKVNISSDEELLSLRPSNKNEDIDIIETYSRTKCFKTNFARLMPFILSKGRFDISTVCFPHKEFIKYIHTDGFVISKKPEQDFKTGNELGNLVYEGYCQNCDIVNSNTYNREGFKI